VLRPCGDERGWAKVKVELELSVQKELQMSHDPRTRRVHNGGPQDA
jgi:hypothetical protein